MDCRHLIIRLPFSHFSHFGQQAFHYLFRHWFHFCNMTIQLCIAVISPAIQSNTTSDTIVTSMSVTIDRFWIDDRIYWALIQRLTTLWSSFLHTHASVHSHVFTSRCSVMASNTDVPLPLGSPTVPVPQLPASHRRSSQRLNLSSSLSP
jgi:hypothetical protein